MQKENTGSQKDRETMKKPSSSSPLAVKVLPCHADTPVSGAQIRRGAGSATVMCDIMSRLCHSVSFSATITAKKLNK